MSSMTTVETRYGMSSRLGYTGDPVFEELENGYGYVCRKADHKMIKLNPLTFFVYKLCGLPVRTAVKAFIRELRTKGIQEDDQTLTDHFFAAVAVLTERGLVNVSGENDENLSVDYSALNIRIVNAYLEITSLCNAHCPYCYNNSGCVIGKHGCLRQRGSGRQSKGKDGNNSIPRAGYIVHFSRGGGDGSRFLFTFFK